MGLRLVLLSALVAVLAAAVVVAGCGNRLQDPADRTSSSATVQPSIPEPTPSAQPYADTPADLRDVCVSFVQTALSYDSTTEARDAFLERLRPLTAPAELMRLRRSQRAHLVWDLLRARGEIVTVEVTGTSTVRLPTMLTAPPTPSASSTEAPDAATTDSSGSSGSSTSVVVEAVRTTTTDMATVREFVEITLGLERTADGWRVVSAHGGGL